MKKEDLVVGKIYFIAFSSNTQIVGRYKGQDVCNLFFFDLHHFWNGFKTFRHNEREYCVTSGITEIRPASKSEKHSLFESEMEFDCI